MFYINNIFSVKLYDYKKLRRATGPFFQDQEIWIFPLNCILIFKWRAPARLVLFRNITCVFPWNWKLKPRLRLKLADGIIFNFQRLGKFAVWLCVGKFYPLIFFVVQNILKRFFFFILENDIKKVTYVLENDLHLGIQISFELYFSFLKWDNHGSKS